MLKISKLIASIAIASGAMIGADANAVLFPNLGCKRLHGDTIGCALSNENSFKNCLVTGPSVNGGCVTKFMRIGAGRDFALDAQRFIRNDSDSKHPFSSEISIQRDDGVLIHKESFNCQADYCPASFSRKFKNSHKRNKNFQARVKSFNAESSDTVVVVSLSNY